MSEPQMPTTITMERRHFWPYLIIGLTGVVALVEDLIRAGTSYPKYSTFDRVQVAIVITLVCAAAWRYSVSRFRTPIVLTTAIAALLDLATGHYRVIDTLTLIEDCVWMGAALALAWPLKRYNVTIESSEDSMAK